jgi:hypothetical protein
MLTHTNEFTQKVENVIKVICPTLSRKYLFNNIEINHFRIFEYM